MEPDSEPINSEVILGHENKSADISEVAKQTVIQAHNHDGHPSRQSLLQMMRLAGSHPLAIERAEVYQCPTCIARSAPTETMKTTPTVRPYGFNDTIYIDIKFVHDTSGRAWAALSTIVDAGTILHMACVVKTKQPCYIARKLMRNWITLFGAPCRLIHHKG